MKGEYRSKCSRRRKEETGGPVPKRQCLEATEPRPQPVHGQSACENEDCVDRPSQLSSKEHVARQPSSEERVARQSSSEEHVARQSSSEEHVARRQASNEEHIAKQASSEEHVARQASSEEHVARRQSSNEEHVARQTQTQLMLSSEEHVVRQSSSEEHVARQTQTQLMLSSQEHVVKEKKAQVAVGINEVTKLLEKGRLRAGLVCLSFKPHIVHQHLQILSASRSVPCIALRGLSETTASALGVKSALAVGLKVSN